MSDAPKGPVPVCEGCERLRKERDDMVAQVVVLNKQCDALLEQNGKLRAKAKGAAV